MEKIEPSIKTSFEEKRKKRILVFFGVLLGLISIALIYIYVDYYQNRFFPKIYLDEIYISGLTKEEARGKLEKFYKDNVFDLNESSLTVFYDDITAEKSLIELACSSNFEEILNEAFDFGHGGSFEKRLGEIIRSYWQIEEKYLELSCNHEKLKSLITEVKKSFDTEAASASAKLIYSANPNYITVDPGKNGRELLLDESLESLESKLKERLINLEKNDLKMKVVIASTSAQLNSDQVELVKERVKSFVGQELIFEKDYQRYRINDQKLVSLLFFPDGIDNRRVNEEKINQLAMDWEKLINQDPVNAVFSYNQETLRVEEFIDDEDGLVLDTDNLEKTILETVFEIEKISQNYKNEKAEDGDENNQKLQNKTWFFELPAEVSPAEIQLKNTNNLGIKEIIGFGESWYYHSIPTRIYNVSLTNKRMDKIIIAPGKSFYFNQALGDVSEKTGYRSAYIIQDGQTKLAPGGGVCQVSSTLFRAVLDAGLKVTLRLPHSYRVEYYEINKEPGFDATVFSGNIDLRFINDTDHHILLKFDSNSENLYMTVKIYGTNDGRTTEITNYKKWGYVSAPAPQYIPDPSLAPGQLKQIDWATSGIKAEFSNIVRSKNGELIREDYYYSSYRPWSAKYLQGI